MMNESDEEIEGLATEMQPLINRSPVVNETNDNSPGDADVLQPPEKTSVLETSEKTSVLETSEKTSVLETSEKTSVLETSEKTSVLETSEKTSSPPPSAPPNESSSPPSAPPIESSPSPPPIETHAEKVLKQIRKYSENCQTLWMRCKSCETSQQMQQMIDSCTVDQFKNLLAMSVIVGDYESCSALLPPVITSPSPQIQKSSNKKMTSAPSPPPPPPPPLPRFVKYAQENDFAFANSAKLVDGPNILQTVKYFLNHPHVATFKDFHTLEVQMFYFLSNLPCSQFNTELLTDLWELVKDHFFKLSTWDQFHNIVPNLWKHSIKLCRSVILHIGKSNVSWNWIDKFADLMANDANDAIDNFNCIDDIITCFNDLNHNNKLQLVAEFIQRFYRGDKNTHLLWTIPNWVSKMNDLLLIFFQTVLRWFHVSKTLKHILEWMVKQSCFAPTLASKSKELFQMFVQYGRDDLIDVLTEHVNNSRWAIMLEKLK